MDKTVTFSGAPVEIAGSLPASGAVAPDFSLADNDLKECVLADYAGLRKVLNIFPSIDTSTCAATVRVFNQRAASATKAVVLCISKDLPFASKRFCEGEGVENLKCLSAFRNAGFGGDYGVEIVEGPLKGLFARAVVVLDEDNKVLHSELVGEITDEPNYDAALTALSS